MDGESTQLTLRDRNRIALRHTIRQAAMGLFRTQGFAATTVDQIAKAAGVSRRTFFHHFPTKEDVVLGDTEVLGENVRRLLEARPAEESAWTALSEALRGLELEGDVEDQLAIAQLYSEAPTLRARHIEKHLRWQALFAPDIAGRLGIPDSEALTDPRPRAVVAAVLSCLDVAVDEWHRCGGAVDLADVFRDCVAAIRS